MIPEGAPAEMSLLFPTTAGLGPFRGIAGMFGALTHGTCFQSVFGYAAVKHPFFGAGFTSMEWLQSFRRFASSGDTCSFAEADFWDFGGCWDAAGPAAYTSAIKSGTVDLRRSIFVCILTTDSDRAGKNVAGAESRIDLYLRHE